MKELVKFWTLFGASNHLLAAYSACVRCGSTGAQRSVHAAPMAFVLVITCGTCKLPWQYHRREGLRVR